MTDDDTYQQQADLIGDPTEDLVFDGTATDVVEMAAAIDERNQRHLNAYARAMQLHLDGDRCLGRPCPGGAVADAIDLRQHLAPDYATSLVFSALALIGDQRAQIAQLEAERADLGAKAMRLDADLIDAQGRLADVKERLDAVERWPADARPEIGDLP